MSEFDALRADPELLKSIDELEQSRYLVDHEKAALNRTLKRIIWTKLPEMKKRADSPEGAECLFQIAKLFLLDLKRIHLIGTQDDRVKSVTLQFLSTPGSRPLIGYAAIVGHLMQEYLNRAPYGQYANEASTFVSDKATNPRDIGTASIAYCIHTTTADFVEIQPFLEEVYADAAKRSCRCLFVSELGGIARRDPKRRIDYHGFTTIKSWWDNAFQQVKLGFAPTWMTGSSPVEIEGNPFQQALWTFLANRYAEVAIEDLSFEAWSLHETAHELTTAVEDAIATGDESQLIETQLRWIAADIQALRKRDMDFSLQIQREIDSTPGTMVITARGAGHRIALDEQLSRLGISFRSFVPPHYCDGPCLQVVQSLLAEPSARMNTSSLSPEHRLLLLKEPIANALQQTLNAMGNLLGAHLQLSSSQRNHLIDGLIRRWDSGAVTRYLTSPPPTARQGRVRMAGRQRKRYREGRFPRTVPACASCWNW